MPQILSTRLGFGTIALVLAGCTESPASGPPFSECVIGGFFADCGGEDEPVFACYASDGQCRWFSGGTVAREYSVRSDCPSTDMCCHENYPFPSVFEGLYGQLYQWGQSPWNATREMNVSVTFMDTIEVAPFSCEGQPPGAGNGAPCTATQPSDRGLADLGDYWSFRAFSNFGISGWYPLIEVDPVLQAARVCTFWYTDSNPPGGDCPLVEKLECAVGGEVVLSGHPEVGGLAIQGFLDVEFEDFSIRGSFTYAKDSDPRSSP